MVSSPTRATEPDTWLVEHADAVSGNLRLSNHLDAKSQLEIWFSADNTLNVKTDCSGCLLDVSIRAWTGSSGPGTVDARGDSRAELGPEDAFRFTPAATTERPFAWDIVVAMETERGVVEEMHTVFGKLTRAGFQRVTWDDYVVENRYAQYEQDGEKTVMRMIGTVEVMSTEAVLAALRADAELGEEKAVSP
jgi:hypothetical protein